jgi:hypothetical protein
MYRFFTLSQVFTFVYATAATRLGRAGPSM